MENSFSRIGNYELDRVIGRGNFAVVRLANHTITNMKVIDKRERGHRCKYNNEISIEVRKD